jgi:Domain of unknown function (DUF4124)
VRHSRTMADLGHRGAILIAVAVAIWPPCPLRASEVYKSVDAQGHVVYSDRAATSKAQKSEVHVDHPDPTEVARNAKEQEILKAEEIQRKRQQSIEDTKKAQQEHNRQVQCDNARNHYYAMKDARRIYEQDATGNRIFYSDVDADAKREEARQAMATVCGT